MDSCIFCKIIKKELPAKLIDETDDLVVFLSLQNHPLIVTKKHYQNLYELDDKTATAIMLESIKIAKAVKRGLNADGVNILQNNESASGQEVFHYHMHIKPRFHKDNVTIHFPQETLEDPKKQTILEKIKSALE